MKKVDIDKKEILLFDFVEPEGNNHMSSRASFLQRKLFEQKIEHLPIFSKNKPIDILYENILFGKKNANFSINLKLNKLKQIQQKEGTVLAVNFVSDAFLDLKKEWIKLINKNLIVKEGPFLNLELENGWVDFSKSYYDLMSNYYNKLKKYIKNNNKDKKIKDFQSFLLIFCDFLDSITPFLPISASSFNLSRFSSPHNSGLVLDLKKENCGDDKRKIKFFFNDKNFLIFKKTCMKFGFTLDKHIPWRIYADILSPALDPYLKNYNLIGKNIFKEYYDILNFLDMNLLKIYVSQMFNAYVTGKSKIIEISYQICNKQLSIKTKTLHRKTINELTLEKIFSDELLVKFYVYVLAREKNLNWTQEYFKQIVQNALNIKKNFGEIQVSDYIQGKLAINFGTSLKKERNFFMS